MRVGPDVARILSNRVKEKEFVEETHSSLVLTLLTRICTVVIFLGRFFLYSWLPYLKLLVAFEPTSPRTLSFTGLLLVTF